MRHPRRSSNLRMLIVRSTRPAILSLLFVVAAPFAIPVSAQDDPCTIPFEERAPQAEPVVVCGTTVVSGPAGTTISLRVPTDSVLNLHTMEGRWKYAEAIGTAPFVGFVLTDNRPATSGGAFLIGMHLADGYWGIVPDWSVSNDPFPQLTYGRHLVPPGTYSLYLLAPSGTVSVSLPFESRPGTEEVSAERATGASVELLRSVVPDPTGRDQQQIASQGKPGSLGAAGFLGLYASVIEAGAATPEAGNFCLYNGHPSNEATAYWPGCPASVEGMQAWSYPPPGFWPPTQQQLLYGAPEGDWALGHWWTTSSPALRISAFSIFVPYEQELPVEAPSSAMSAADSSIPPVRSASVATVKKLTPPMTAKN